MSLSSYMAMNNEMTPRSRPIGPAPNLSFFSCLVFWGMYNFLVPPSDDFGDWATPKEPTVGHFFLRFQAHGPLSVGFVVIRDSLADLAKTRCRPARGNESPAGAFRPAPP